MKAFPAAAGGVEEVRFLDVDTPVTYEGNQPLAPEATVSTIRQLEGEKVELEYDQERMDPYDRL